MLAGESFDTDQHQQQGQDTDEELGDAVQQRGEQIAIDTDEELSDVAQKQGQDIDEELGDVVQQREQVAIDTEAEFSDVDQKQGQYIDEKLGDAFQQQRQAALDTDKLGDAETHGQGHSVADALEEDLDGELFESKAKAKESVAALLKAIKAEFTPKVCKEIIIDALKEADIELYSKKREVKELAVDVDDFKRRIQSMNMANLSLGLELTGDPVQQCIQINNKIKTMVMTKYVSQIAIFVYLLRMHTIIKQGEQGSNARALNEGLMEGLEFTKSQQLSKFKRKCDRVNQLVDMFGRGGGCALGMYVRIFTLENACKEDWKQLVDELARQTSVYAYCMSLEVDRNGMPVDPAI